MQLPSSVLSRFLILFLSCFALVACDKSSKTVTPTTPIIKPREPIIALALGGGGAKGFAHIGAIKILESHGIKAKIVTGTSAGSFVGSLYASGKSGFQLQEIALKLEESDIRDLTISKQGFITGQKLQDFVNKQIGNKPIQQFPIRFAAVATQLDNGQKVAFNKGNAGQAVRASCSIPNVFIPATIGGKRYVDGGLVSPIPVQTARDLGADIVIAIDISARPKAGQSTNLWGLLDQTLNIMGQQTINQELAQADIVIKPQVGNLGVMDLKSRHQSILEGERAAQLQLAAIDLKIKQFKQSAQAKLPAPRPKLQ